MFAMEHGLLRHWLRTAGRLQLTMGYLRCRGCEDGCRGSGVAPRLTLCQVVTLPVGAMGVGRTPASDPDRDSMNEQVGAVRAPVS
jgi:hypothetical protein